MTANRDKLLLVGFGVAVGSVYAAIVSAASEFSIVGLTCAVVLLAAIPLVAWQLSRTEADQTTAQKLSMIALSPVVIASTVFVLAAILPLMLFVIPIVAVLALRRMLKDGRLMRSLAKKGRLMPLSQLAPRLEAGEGTLLEETGHKGVCRIWWTSDDLASIAPNIEAGERFVQLLEGNDVDGFNQLCLDYLGESQGKAILTSIPPRHARSGKLSRRFPKAKRVTVVRLNEN